MPRSPSPDRRATLKDVAERAGVHISTAWRALKNNTYVAAERRARIRQAAAELGYVPDPMLSALSHYRRKLRAPDYRATLAWVHAWPDPERDLKAPHLAAYLEGARRTAAGLGFKVDVFWLGEPGLQPGRAREVLLARGVRGLVLAPFPRPGASLPFDLEAFSAVAIGVSIASPRLHVVGSNQHSATLRALSELAALGHSRIGMVSTRETLVRTQHNFESPYCLLQYRQPENRRIPLLAFPGRDEPSNLAPRREEFLEWFHRYRPTAIVSTISETLPWLQGAGVQVPGDVSLASLSLIHEPGWSGIDQLEEQIGSRAAELLISLFNNGERGVPGTPVRLLVEGRWIEGQTTRRIGPPANDLVL